jgi:hypothetical protein
MGTSGAHLVSDEAAFNPPISDCIVLEGDLSHVSRNNRQVR